MIEFMNKLFVQATLGLSTEKEEGQGLVEYALIIALIAIFVITALGFLGEQIEAIFNNIGDELGV